MTRSQQFHRPGREAGAAPTSIAPGTQPSGGVDGARRYRFKSYRLTAL